MAEINNDQLRLARTVRDACVRAAKEGYERAAMSGLCAEGALEAAVSTIEMLDLNAVLDAGEAQVSRQR